VLMRSGKKIAPAMNTGASVENRGRPEP